MPTAEELCEYRALLPHVHELGFKTLAMMLDADRVRDAVKAKCLLVAVRAGATEAVLRAISEVER